jgi:hypothetical protein
MWTRFWLFSLVATASVSLAANDLLKNGGFEDGLAPWQASFGTAGCVSVVEKGAQSGTHCLQVVCKDQIAGVDFPRFRLGRDLPRTGSYRLRAALRTGGIPTGDFGLRLYFYTATGEYLAMHGGITVKGDKPGDWKMGEITFGRGTKKTIPPAAATMMVRFSMWADTPGATGTAWLDSVSLEQTDDALQIQRTKPLAWVWRDDTLGNLPTDLSAQLITGGFDVTEKTTAQLIAPGALDAERADLLVLPYGGLYPVELGQSLPTFCRESGALMTFGAPPFTRPLYQTPAGMHELGAGDEELTVLPAEAAWTEQHGGPNDVLTAEPGRTSRQFKTDLKSYAYAGTDLAPLSASDAVLEVQTRGDGKTARICIELHEQDGSRWKRILPLTDAWVTHRLHLAEFASYNNKDRGADGDHLNPKQLKRLMVGMTRTMVAEGPHRFELRGLRMLRANVPSAAVASTMRFVPYDIGVTRWFGEKYTVEPWVVSTPSCVEGSSETRTRLRYVADDSLAKGKWQVWRVGSWLPPTPRKDGKRQPLGRVLAASAAAFRVPLLQAENALGGALPCAALIMHRDGAFAGSRWATFALQPAKGDLPAPVAKAVTGAARALATGAWIKGPHPTFRVQDGEVVMDVSLPVANPSPTDVQMTVSLRIGDTAPIARQISAPARHAAVVDHVLAKGLPAPDLASQALLLTVDLTKATGPVFGPRRFEVDLKKQLRVVSDFMVQEARDDAKLHGYSFIDNRGMRALLGAYEILGDRRYLKTALRWGETMVKEQREDGGYRMGYGITRKGEACYVADGGEIVVGVLRLASYAKGAQRQRFLDSTDRYMAYREEFRVETGGIGVGWCMQDYGKRPIPKLDKPTRIYSPENNTYTIGCTLAGAYAHAFVHGTPELERRAEKDADWLIPRAPRLNGAFIESYMFAHAFATTPERKKLYADYIDRVFTQVMVDSYSTFEWWLSGGGRTALNLDGLAYAVHRLGAGPAVRAEMYRALCAMYSPQSPRSIPTVISSPVSDHDPWIYINFGTLGLVDVLKPIVSIDGWK